MYSSDWATPTATLKEVFTSLENASLALNLAKCNLARGSVLYLGQQVGLQKVCLADAKVSAINEFPQPTTRRELRRFLGITGYYWRFCKNLSSVVAPLTDLISPSEPFV